MGATKSLVCCNMLSRTRESHLVPKIPCVPNFKEPREGKSTGIRPPGGTHVPWPAGCAHLG